jgi:phage-related holin
LLLLLLPLLLLPLLVLLLLLLVAVQADTIAALQAVVAEGEADHLSSELKAGRIIRLVQNFKCVIISHH